MSMPKYMRRNTSPAAIVTHTENLIKYLFTITNNEKQFPKVMRYTISTDIRNTCLKLEKAIYNAMAINPRYRKQYKKRVKYQQKAFKAIVDLKALLVIAVDIASIKNLEYLSTLLNNVIIAHNHWVKNDKKKYSDLPSYKEYMASQYEKRYRTPPTEFTDPLYRDLEGFIILKRRDIPEVVETAKT